MTSPTPSHSTGRPAAVVLAVILITLSLALTIWSIFANRILDNLNQLPPWYPALLVGQLALVVASIVGLWQMKKWGAVCFFVNVALNLVIMFALGAINPIGLILPAIIVVSIATKLNQMD